MNKEILKLIFSRAEHNVYGCINNTRDINRATSVGEAKWHVRKYTQPLAYDKLGLMEDIQIISSIISSHKIKIFDDKESQNILAKIFQAWEQVDISIKPYQVIFDNLRKLSEHIN